MEEWKEWKNPRMQPYRRCMQRLHKAHITPDDGTFLGASLGRLWQQSHHAGMRAKMSPREEYKLSPRVWKEQWGLGHLGEVSLDDVG